MYFCGNGFLITRSTENTNWQRDEYTNMAGSVKRLSLSLKYAQLSNLSPLCFLLLTIICPKKQSAHVTLEGLLKPVRVVRADMSGVISVCLSRSLFAHAERASHSAHRL